MFISRLAVKKFGPIDNFDHTFKSVNAVIGMNGKGKTHLLDLLATLAGNAEATEIKANKQIGRVHIEIETYDGDRELTLEGHLDSDKIAEFKEKLGENKINYGLPETRSERYINGNCDYVALREDIDQFFAYTGLPTRLFTRGLRDAIKLGDGHRHALKMFFLLNMKNQPLMLDMPETHLDMSARRYVQTRLRCSEQQVIFVTHCPMFIEKLLTSTIDM